MENYSLLMGDSSVDEDGGGVDGEAFRGHFPVPAACRNRDSCPPDLGFAMAAALEGFSYRGFSVSWLFRLEVLGRGPFYRRRGGVRRSKRRPGGKAARANPRPRRPPSWWACGPPLVLPGCSGSFVEK